MERCYLHLWWYYYSIIVTLAGWPIVICHQSLLLAAEKAPPQFADWWNSCKTFSFSIFLYFALSVSLFCSFFILLFLFLYFASLFSAFLWKLQFAAFLLPQLMLLVHLPSNKFLDKFLGIINDLFYYRYFWDFWIFLNIRSVAQLSCCLLSLVASVFSSANRASSFHPLFFTQAAQAALCLETHCIMHRVLHYSALVVQRAASARTNNWNGGVWEDRRRDRALITTKSNQPTPPSSAKLGLLKIQLFFFFFPLGRNTPLVRTLGVQAPGFDIVQGGACQGPNFRGDSNLDFGRGGQSEELTRSPQSKKLETDKQRADEKKSKE